MFGRSVLAMVFWTLIGPIGPVQAESLVTVSNRDDLILALKRVEPGTALLLAGGDYGEMSFKDLHGSKDAPILIRSADQNDPVLFSRMNLRDSSYVTLEGLLFDYRFQAGDKSNLRPFKITKSRNVILRNSIFDGDRPSGVSAIADGFGTAFGLTVRGSVDVLIEDNEIRDFFRGFQAAQSAALTIRGNNIHTIRMDGMNFAQVENVVIENNHIHDFNRSLKSKDHADMIQFWTAGTTVRSSDIIIRNNILNSGQGWYTQSIFMRNELVDRGEAGKEMFYQNVTIEGNVIVNAHVHGITVGETVNLNIQNNTLIRNARSEGAVDNLNLWTPQIRVAPTSTQVRIHKNVVSAIAGYSGQHNWTEADNFLIQDRNPNHPGYYDTVFVSARHGDPANLGSYSYLPGGALDGTGIGTPLLDEAPAVTSLSPLIRVTRDADFFNRFTYDATKSRDANGVLDEKSIFEWAFPDGEIVIGRIITHEFTKPGVYSTVLTITNSAGQTASAKVETTVNGPDILSFNAESGAFTSWRAGVPSIILNTPVTVGPAIIGQGRATIGIDRYTISPLFESRDFDLQMRIRAKGSKRPGGVLFHIPRTLLITVSGRGLLSVKLETATAKPLRLKTGPLRLLSGDWRDIQVSYSSYTGIVVIKVDGDIWAEGKTSGRLKPLQHWGVSLGNPFNNQNKTFDGEMESMWLRADIFAYPNFH